MVYVPSRMQSIENLDQLRLYVEEEFKAISRELGEMTAVELRPIFAAPAKPREGMLVFADGTSWNPGGGKGAYQYSGGAWVKL